MPKKINYEKTRNNQNISPTRPDEGKTWSDEIDQSTGKPVVEEQPGYVPTKKDVEGKTGFVILFWLFGQANQKKKNLDWFIQDLQKDKLINDKKIQELYEQFYNWETELKTWNMTIDLGKYEEIDD